MTPKNKQAKTEWLAKKFAHILSHNPGMKPLRLQDEAMDRWELNGPLTKHIELKEK